MLDISLYISYSVAVFIIVLVSGCALNLLKRHYIFQLFGIAFLFTYMIFESIVKLWHNDSISIKELYVFSLPMLTGISGCLVSIALGFWVFPPIRRKFKN